MSKLAIPRFGRLLVAARTDLDLSQQQLADRTRIPRGQLSQIERGWRRPTVEQVDRLESCLGQSWSPLWKAVFSSPVPTWERRGLATVKQRTSFLPFRPYESDYRLKCAYAEYPERMKQLELAILRLTDATQRLIFLQDAVYDSDLGAVTYAEVCSWPESNPVRTLAPMQSGFRELPVIERAKGRIVGDRPHPALLIKLGAYTLTLFPQLRLRGRDFKTYRLDGLLGVKKGRVRRWFALNINGGGHDFKKDPKRCKALRLPWIDVDEEEIVSGDLKAILLGKIVLQLEPPTVAA